MISSQEFYQKLQAGRIHEALTLVMQSVIELDITTRITEDLEESQSDCHEYLRTKVDLLTGNIENEVSQNVVSDSPRYLKLQQLHLDRINTTHRIVRDYLHQIRAILTVLPPSALAEPLLWRNGKSIENMSIPSATAHDPVNLASPPLEVEPDEDLDLSIECDGEVWEEWVEDEEFMPGVGVPQPPLASSISTLPDRAEYSPLPRQFHPIEVKPNASRSLPVPVSTPSAWDKFAPEYIEIGTDAQPRRTIDSNTNHHLDKRSTNSDI